MQDRSLAEDSASRTKHQFVTLDGLRGIAAIVVVLRHLPELFGHQLVAHGYLAVDFFFFLSGFVIAHAYQARLDAGWPTADFLKIRFARLYPMYFLGLILGLISFLVARHLLRDATSPRTLSISLVLGLFVLPVWKSLLPGALAYPLNFPTWSLFSEGVANILHALFLRRLAQRTLQILALLCLSSLAYLAAKHHTIDYGMFPVGLIASLPRFMFPYIVGILLYKRWKQHPQHLRIPPVASAILLSLILAIPGHGRTALFVDFFCIVVALPTLLWVSNGSITSGRPPLILGILGQLSYPLYILHIPLSRFFVLACFALTSHPPADFAPWSGILFLLIAISCSLLFEKLYDQPARNWLRKRLAA